MIGSFLNVCILRWGAEPKQSVVRPPSRCPKCGRGIRWFENIPIVSWLVLRGRCRGCRAADLGPVSADRAGHGPALGLHGLALRLRPRGASRRGVRDAAARHRHDRRAAPTSFPTSSRLAALALGIAFRAGRRAGSRSATALLGALLRPGLVLWIGGEWTVASRRRWRGEWRMKMMAMVGAVSRLAGHAAHRRFSGALIGEPDLRAAHSSWGRTRSWCRSASSSRSAPAATYLVWPGAFCLVRRLPGPRLMRSRLACQAHRSGRPGPCVRMARSADHRCRVALDDGGVERPGVPALRSRPFARGRPARPHERVSRHPSGRRPVPPSRRTLVIRARAAVTRWRCCSPRARRPAAARAARRTKTPCSRAGGQPARTRRAGGRAHLPDAAPLGAALARAGAGLSARPSSTRSCRRRECAGSRAAYRLFGLLPDTLELRGLLLDLYAEQVAGYYDPDSTTLFGVAGADRDAAPAGPGARDGARAAGPVPPARLDPQRHRQQRPAHGGAVHPRGAGDAGLDRGAGAGPGRDRNRRSSGRCTATRCGSSSRRCRSSRARRWWCARR